MLYTNKLAKNEKSNNFVKSAAAESAVLQLVANLGTVRLSEVVRVFRPADAAWHAEVALRIKAYLRYEYAHAGQARTQYDAQAKAQKVQQGPLWAALGPLEPTPELPASEARKLMRSGSPAKLIGTEATAWVDLDTGLRGSRLRKLTRPVLEAHWLRARSLAIDIADRSAAARASRVLARLVSDKRLDVQRGFFSEKLYSLTKRGSRFLGDSYEDVGPRSSMQSEHKTLANGYLLFALCTAHDGWSEGSLAARTPQPGVLSTPGKLQHKDLYDGILTGRRSASSSIHPADGLVLRLAQRVNDTEDWSVELIEAERGKKQNTDFIKGLYPLQHGKNLNSKITKPVKLSDGSLVKRDFRVLKITYVMSSEEFVSPLLKACYQFVTGLRPDKAGHWEKAGSLLFVGSGAAGNDDTQAKWEELLSMVNVAYCPLSSLKRNFMGVPFHCTLLELTRERGLLDHTKVQG